MNFYNFYFSHLKFMPALTLVNSKKYAPFCELRKQPYKHIYQCPSKDVFPQC